MKTRVISIAINGDNEIVLEEYAQKLGDMVDEAMEAQEENKMIPAGVIYEGVAVIDPDNPEKEEVKEDETGT